jgi:hypothetical protein
MREVAGWFLVVLGLLVFYVCFSLLLSTRPWILEAGPLTLIGIIIFRAGIHLLKVAVAARVCLHAQREASTVGRAGGVSPLMRDQGANAPRSPVRAHVP